MALALVARLGLAAFDLMEAVTSLLLALIFGLGKIR